MKGTWLNTWIHYWGEEKGGVLSRKAVRKTVKCFLPVLIY
jgi:hypothetical protein